jgi:hypothetical protein
MDKVRKIEESYTSNILYSQIRFWEVLIGWTTRVVHIIEWIAQ